MWKQFGNSEENDCLNFSEKMIGGRFLDDECLLKPKGLRREFLYSKNIPTFKEEIFSVDDERPFMEKWRGYIGNTY